MPSSLVKVLFVICSPLLVELFATSSKLAEFQAAFYLDIMNSMFPFFQLYQLDKGEKIDKVFDMISYESAFWKFAMQ